MAADPSEHVAQAKRLIAERRYQDAVRALRRALVSQPEHLEARLLLGTALLALERYDEVRAEMLALSRKAPKEPRAQRVLGEAYLRSGKVEKAVEALRRALALDPDDGPARELLAEAGEEPPPSTRTIDRWFDPEAVATIQTSAPDFAEEGTGPGIVLPEAGGGSTSILVDPAFQRAIDEAGSSEITNPPIAPYQPPRPRPASLLALLPPSAPSDARAPLARGSLRPGPPSVAPASAPQPVHPARRPHATLQGMPAVLGPAPRPGTRPRPDETQQLELGQLEAVQEADADALEDSSDSAILGLAALAAAAGAPRSGLCRRAAAHCRAAAACRAAALPGLGACRRRRALPGLGARRRPLPGHRRPPGRRLPGLGACRRRRALPGLGACRRRRALPGLGACRRRRALPGLGACRRRRALPGLGACASRRASGLPALDADVARLERHPAHSRT